MVNLSQPNLLPAEIGAWFLLEWDTLIGAVIVDLLNILLEIHWCAKTKVQELQMPLCGQHQIVRLQVTVDEARLMDGIDRLNQLCHIKLGFVDGEFILLLHVGKKIATLHELHDQVQIPGILEGAQEISKPKAKTLGHRVSFVVCLHPILVAEVVLPDLLQGIDFLCPLTSNQVHHAKRTFAQDLQTGEVLYRPHPQICSLALFLCLNVRIASSLPILRMLFAVFNLSCFGLQILLCFCLQSQLFI
mmetsp:Transcript_67468/g.147874  ORF Transcript_67468/g.147874 Transcript_67468/m.147874 type:complete len:246 (-) Transcript_67468:166-903(-)